ncbi:metallophosphoesterase [Alphaproteobacteria bacterium]|nr:metallophosphoesterase [Alphaproteobacteria bacterium]
MGDVAGQVGMKIIERELPDFKKEQNIDVTIIDIDNTDKGLGTTQADARRMANVGAEVLTGGNHIFDKYNEKDEKDGGKGNIIDWLYDDSPLNGVHLLRPNNMHLDKYLDLKKDEVSKKKKQDNQKILEKHRGAEPGTGYCIVEKEGKKILVVHLLGKRNVAECGDNPFYEIDKILKDYTLKQNASTSDVGASNNVTVVDAIVIDYHGESTLEKQLFAHYVSGRVSAVVGTHTHVPTADAQILKGGTAYQTDIGMCGDYNSVLSMKIEDAIRIHKSEIETAPASTITAPRETPPTKTITESKETSIPQKDITANEDQTATLCGTIVEIGDDGLAVSINPIKISRDDNSGDDNSSDDNSSDDNKPVLQGSISQSKLAPWLISSRQLNHSQSSSVVVSGSTRPPKSACATGSAKRGSSLPPLKSINSSTSARPSASPPYYSTKTKK